MSLIFERPTIGDKEWINTILVKEKRSDALATFGTYFIWSDFFGTKVCRHKNIFFRVIRVRFSPAIHRKTTAKQTKYAKLKNLGNSYPFLVRCDKFFTRYFAAKAFFWRVAARLSLIILPQMTFLYLCGKIV